MRRRRALPWRWRSPPESSRGSRFSLPASPVWASDRATDARSSAESFRAGEMPRPTLSSTVKWANRLFSWKTMETGRSAGASAVTSRPPMRMRPEAGASKPATRLSSVDLPEPLGPMTAVIAPALAKQSNAIAAPAA